jgi:hypothetical protein
VAGLVPWGVVVCGLDDPIERRRGDTMHAHGLSRDPVRSSHAPVVHGRGLRWRRGRLRPPIPWAPRVGARPCLTVRCPSERCSKRRGRRARTVVERAGQMSPWGVRCLPGRAVVFVADRRYAALAWRDHVQQGSRARGITRRRLDAARDDPPPRREPRPHGRPRLHGQRRAPREAVLPETETPWTTLTVDHWSGEGPREVEGCTDTAVWDHAGKPPVPLRWGRIRAPTGAGTPQALWSTTLEQTPEHLLPWCVRRWTIAVPCEDARAPVGRATPRQGHERAMGRTTPVLLSRYALIPLTAHLLIHQGATGVRRMAWHPQTRPPCADAMALVRRHVWDHLSWSMSQQAIDLRQIPPTLLERVTEALCYAA